MLTSNADLRQEIDSLRVERKRFEGVYKKLDKELVSLRKQIAEEIDQSTLAYDARSAYNKVIHINVVNLYYLFLRIRNFIMRNSSTAA